MTEDARWWFVSSRRMTFAVEVTDGRVTASAPIGRRFIGQPARSLGDWMRKQGGFHAERLGASGAAT